MDKTLDVWLVENALPYDFFTMLNVEDREDTRRFIENILKKYDAFGLPSYMLEGVFNWLFHGIKPGNFLTGVIENDLLKAANSADFINHTKIKDWANFVYKAFPDQARDSANWVGYENLRKEA